MQDSGSGGPGWDTPALDTACVYTYFNFILIKLLCVMFMLLNEAQTNETVLKSNVNLHNA